MKQLIKTTLTLSTILLLTACGQGDGEGKQNSEHGLLNTPPVAQAQTKALKEDSSVTITLKAIDEDNDTLGYKVTTAPKYGKLEGKAPNLSYVPHKDYNGNDSFSFIANDGLVDSNEGVVSMEISSVNDMPIAKGDKVITDEDRYITIDVLSNDTDIDIATNQDTLTIVDTTSSYSGKVSIKDNKIIYTPNPNYNGDDSFSYTIKDKGGLISTAAVYVTINPVNDVPVAKDDNAITPINNSITISVLSNDSDIDKDEKLTVIKVEGVKNGIATIKDNKIIYQPNKDYLGTEKLTYTIKDNAGATAKANIEITIRELSDEEKYKQLEDQGIVPKLDRSDDLAGPDIDNNGIRDDVDDYINKNITNPNKKAAIQQIARVYQEVLVTPVDTQEKAKIISNKMGLAINCVVARDAMREDDLVMAYTFNTKKRTMKYIQYNDLLDGTVSSLPEGDTCEK